MSSSSEVFKLRRDRQIDAAYEMARERITSPDRDAWDVRAYAWCLIDLLKANARKGSSEAAEDYARQLRALELPENDEILTKERGRALSLLEEGADEIAQAQEHSKAGRLRDAIKIYADLARRKLLGPEISTNYGWDLYKATKDLLGKKLPEELPPAVVGEARRHLNAYMGLEVERPSQLHSCMLYMASRLASGDHLKMLPFARLWGLEHLRQEDLERFAAKDGKSIPALAEKVVMKAAKEAAETGNRADLDYMLLFVDRMMARFPDNHWLELNKVKLLRALGRQDEARNLALSFTKTKSQEYWAWELLGDLQADPGTRLACYCKSLTCSQDDNFVSPLRLKLAREFLDAGHAAEAKGEIERILEHKKRSGHRVPVDVQDMTAMDWYAAIDATPPKVGFYARFATAADDLLFSDLPWIDACVGETFTVEGQDGKPRRKLYLKTPFLPAEVSIPENRLKLKSPRIGQPIRVKADYDPEGERRLILHAVSDRPDGAPFDIFPETVGIIDHVNPSKGLMHFTAGREAQGTFPLAHYKGIAAVGAFVSFKLATFQSRKGGGVRALTAEATSKTPGAQVCRSFQSMVKVRNGLGFTDDNIFIPPDLVRTSDINDEDVVTGVAVQSFDKRKGNWGWKAILVGEVNRHR
ncbi:hypothetical protein IGS68_15635 [Skermanella sp. TT6]|uniref:Tetratricopeptide repeat protein n=1 Tax=Skermanella cutis TaxID=2775420 RepID=A0ABX7B079_9PROT|nr:hypothetical protein [Skermanella sp. TT6]QQP87532.1 hypothetical protein IGS68_15635 [Skermanella sp. TT6]